METSETRPKQKRRILLFFENFFDHTKGSLQFFFHILQQTGVLKSPKGPLLQF